MLIILQISKSFKIIQILVLSGIKFIFAPPVAIEMGFNYFQTILITTIGGIIGVAFFFFVSRFIISLFCKYYPLIIQYLNPGKIIKGRTIKKKFTKRNRRIVNLMDKYGLFGIIALTPVILSIPIGTLIAARFFSKPKYHTFLYLALSVLFWSFIMSTAFFVTSMHL
jgi:hypothetical protein